MAIERAERDLQRLRQRISDLESQVVELREQEVKIVHFLEMYQRYGRGEVPTEPGGEITHRGSEGRQRTPKPPPNVQAAIEILREEGRPITTRVLVDLLAKRGITIGGGNPVTNLSGALSKWKEILSANRTQGWSLREWSRESVSNQPQPAHEEEASSQPGAAKSGVSEDSDEVGDQTNHDVAT